MKILVTGGSGFLGKAMALALIQEGYAVKSLSRRDVPELRQAGAEVLQGDLVDAETVKKALDGCEAVFHAAAKPGVWGPYEDYYDANVRGTGNVIAGCIMLGIQRLVYTSSPSVVFHNRDQQGVDESEPYPHFFLAQYPRTKAMAERTVLKAHSPDLATIALRPHLIWGPGDQHLVPRIISRAKAGKLRIVGTGKNLVDSVYIDNAVEAHLLALKHLSPDAPCGGRAYFITNNEPLAVEDLINRILKAAHLPPVTRRVPAWAAYGAGALMEAAYGIMKKKEEPLMTRFLARELACAHWFNGAAAERDLGYRPLVSIDEGMKHLEEWLEGQG